ncbi:MAG: tetratricopeptide repeat protein [Chloroflexi bacterium]|uniref:Tetratricopeptide repeat protein n=1 Tax=Candidatus Chlorohelix allophototropha TaxID=3003348 RepID=A0A8T7M0F6_9CHLR|nr:tetratricopeptide repeat protein [Chloroflexota bacterium]WJW66723.1 tetratricopeptide repeat protein [Chloroflexota bacterium L227-S17]
MLICNYCRNDNPNNANYCGRCGRRLRDQRSLAKLEKASFCIECGNRRERYPNDRRICTILFADVHGYTAMTEKMDVEKVTNIMNEVFSLLTAEIVGVDGSIDKYAGDNIMARFGAPEALEDHPERAIHAALGMQRQLSRFSLKLQKEEGVGLEMRIGINTGWVSAAEVGGEVDGVSYRTYTVMGDTVNLSSRLEHESRVGKILVGEETYKLAKHAFEFLDTGERQIRGKREPVRTYEVIGPKPQRANRRGLAGKDLQLVGREAELQRLASRLLQAIEGKGQVVSVMGEAGVGKSSLLREFKRRATITYQDVRYISGAAFSYSYTQSFSLVRNAIFKMCDINDNDDEETVQEKLLAQIHLLMGEGEQNEDGEYGEIPSLLGRAVGINFPNSFVDNLDPLLRSRLLNDAISDFLLKKAESNSLLIVLDDLHWADNSSLEVLDLMVQKVTSSSNNMSVLLLLVHRPDFSRQWNVPKERYEEIALESLNPEQIKVLTRQLLDASLGNMDTPINLEHEEPPELPSPMVKILERAGGNPFFAEEILKALLDAQQIVQDPTETASWKIVGDLENFKLPETLQEILLARVDKLGGRDKRVLQVASVIGLRFEQRLLLATEDLFDQQIQVEEALTDLHQEDFVYTERQEPEPEYGFRHSLTREVAYNNLLGTERRRYHEQIGRAIEHFKSDRLHDYTVIDDLAYHYENSDSDEKAVHYLMLAGHMRKTLYRNDEALKAFYEARERLKRNPEAGEEQQLVEINSNIGDIRALKADYSEALQAYEAALEKSANPFERIDLRVRIIEVLGKRGEFEEAARSFEIAQREIQEASGAPDPENRLTHLRAKLLLQIGWIYYLQGKHEAALRVNEESLQALKSLPDTDRDVQVETGRAYNMLGTIFSDIGQLDQAEVNLQRAIEMHQRASNIQQVARVYTNLAVVMILIGNLTQATNYLKQARANAEKVGDVETLGGIIGNLGFVAERQGQLVAAFKYFQDAWRIFERAANQVLAAMALQNCGRVVLQQGNVKNALEYFQQSLKMAESIGATSILAEGSNNIGWALIIDQRLAEAEEWLERAYVKGMESANPEVLANNYMYRGMLELETHNYIKCSEYFDECLKIIEGQLGDPVMLGQIKRRMGRLASNQHKFKEAEQYYNESLETLDPMRAYLEMCYTKFYWAELILHELSEGLIEPERQQEEIEKAQRFLMQASFTFDACEARPAYNGAILLLEQFEQTAPV